MCWRGVSLKTGGGCALEEDRQVFAGLGELTAKGRLAEALAGELARYSVFDLVGISAELEREIAALPSPYREKVGPCFREQYFGRYQRALALRASGAFAGMAGSVSDPGLFRDYCDMVTAQSLEPPREGDPFYGHFYYLLSGFYMFVLDEPGHPVGMPFPGGFSVMKREDGYRCLIRDKERDVPYSICNFCPAKQEDV